MKDAAEIDVAVVGGGPAGVAAAAAAAGLGGRVVLIESTARPGGSVTAAMHRCLCGLYAQAPDSPLDTLNPGIQRQLVAHLLRSDPASVVTRQMGRTWVLEFPGAAYERALLHLCNSPQIDRLFSTRLIGVQREKTRIIAIQVETGSQQKWIDVKAVVDCTGSGALLQLAGEEAMLPADPQRMLGGFSVHLTGLTGDAEMLRFQIPYVLALAVSAGSLPTAARFTVFHPGPGAGEGMCKLAVSPDLFSTGQVQSFADRVIGHLKNELPGFADAVIAAASPWALPRDGRRLKGKTIVTETQVLQAVQHGPDAVHAWWPIEKWDPVTGPGYAYPPEGRHYDIPGEALQSQVIENLFAAGIGVSATAEAAASLRASGICLATGEAAGKLAAQNSSPSTSPHF